MDDINQRLHFDNIDYDDGGVRVKVQYVQQAKNSIEQYLVRLERPPDQGRKDCERKGYMTVTRRRDPRDGGGKPYLEIQFQGQPQQKFYLFRISWHLCRMQVEVQEEEHRD